MLKRPRLPSPPVSQEDPQLPIPIDPSSSFFPTKRRRTLGPIIDSFERGNISLPDDDDDDGEDNVLETDFERNAAEASDDVVQAYEHVNEFLHKLHFQKHPTLRSQADDPHADCQPPLEERSLRSSKISPRLPSLLGEDTPQSRESAFQDTARKLVDDKARERREHALSFHPQAGSVSLVDLEEERLSVANNYEDTNRILGSLVLSRRIDLRSSSYDARS